MKRALSLLAILTVTQALFGCGLQRPDQDNFVVDASGIGGAALARELSSKMETSLKTTKITLPDSDNAEVYWLDGRGFSLTLMPVSDDRCNPNARYLRYKRQQFRVDLVYTNASLSVKETAKRNFLGVVRNLRVPIEKFEECA
jgi:hypothetical protein